MKLNEDLLLEHLPLHKKGFYENDKGEVIVLFVDKEGWKIASFKNGRCNNGESFGENWRDAWRMFNRYVEMDLDDVNYEHDEDNDLDDDAFFAALSKM